MEQSPSERADSTRLNHGSFFCRSSTPRVALAMVKPPSSEGWQREGKEGWAGALKQCRPLVGNVPSSARLKGSTRWAFKTHRNCLPCQCISQPAGSQYCLQFSCNRYRSDPQLENARWKEKKKKKKMLTQQFKTFFWYVTCLSFYYMHREPDLPLKEHAARFA